MKNLSKNLIITLAVILCSFFYSSNAISQIIEPVKWKYEIINIKENTAEIKLVATIEDGWSLYSQDLPVGGPLPTEILFEESKNYKTINKTYPTVKAKIKFDEIFKMEIGSWINSVSFIQKIEVISTGDFNINLDIYYMVCNNSSCIPLDNNIIIPIDASLFSKLSKVDKKENVVEVTNETEESFATSETEETNETVNASITSNEGLSNSKNVAIIESSEENKTKKQSVWIIFWLGIAGGLLSLLTPCVWPIIPMTVSFFLNKTQSKRKSITDALFYGLSIIIVYVLLGLSISLIFGADALGRLATNPYFNIFFFALLVVFAIAFFGAFELTLPSSWVNSLDKKSSKSSGFIGIFFMALTLVLVSFSCTGPILGALLVQAASSANFVSPLIGMLGFSTAIAVPFALLAIFPSLLKSMPKSGGWMNSIKVVLAFFMLLFSLKFFVTADQIAGWNLLSRELFIAIWIVIFIFIGLYLLGKIKMSHDSDVNYTGIGRLFLSMTSFVIAILLLPGLWGAPLNAISGFAPPASSNSFNMNSASSKSNNIDMTIYEGYKIKEASYGLMKFLDYEEGMEFAKNNNKPVFLDFTGIGCTNCKKMEGSVFNNENVLPLLNKYVIISLYTDIREALPEEEQYISNFGGKERKIRTVGQKWSDKQAKEYGVNAQPFYILLDCEGNKISETRAFDTSIEGFIKYLEDGLVEYSK